LAAPAPNDHGSVARLELGRRQIIELLASAVALALGVNLLAFVITDAVSRPFALGIGVLVLLASLVYLAARLIKVGTHTREYQGFFIYRTGTNCVEEIDRYEFGEELPRYLTGLFSEKPGLKRTWDQEPLTNLYGLPEDIEKNRPKRTLALVREAMECFVLRQLSFHLDEQLGRPTEGRTEAISREQVPEVLLQNRFLNLFSEPMEDRAAFGDDRSDTSNVYYALGEQGAIYDRFELVLPKQSKVTRTAPNEVAIATKRFELRIETEFDGGNTYIPWEFHKYYLGHEALLKEGAIQFHAFQVTVRLTTKVSLGSVFAIADWEYYRWVDSFLDRFDRSFSEDAFFSRIGWDTALTVLHCQENLVSQRESLGASGNGSSEPGAS
jgi:hypothetical protein